MDNGVDLHHATSKGTALVWFYIVSISAASYRNSFVQIFGPITGQLTGRQIVQT